MGDKILLTVEERKILGKKVKQLRKEGLVPGVVYGGDMVAKAVMAPTNVATKAWHAAGRHHPIELTIGTKKQLAMIKSADVDPVKHKLRHLSLQIIKSNVKVETAVPVKVSDEGQTPAERAGMVVLQALETVEIQALPARLPDFLQVPGDKLVEQGDHVTVADILAVEGVEVLSDPEIVVASVYEPSALAAANDAAGGTAEDESEVESENGSDAENAESGDENPGDKDKK
jgi:large subunit ribosomal protein L25